MPEGLEIYALNYALSVLRHTKCIECPISTAYGKHLIIWNSIDSNKIQDWSFGLSGRVRFDVHTSKLHKINTGFVTGSITDHSSYDSFMESSKLGIDFVLSNQEDFEDVIEKWKKSKKKLGTLMLDQSFIAGIGVAWGSEILFEADLSPDIAGSLQNLDELASIIIRVRDKMIGFYKNIVDKYAEDGEIIEFINGWYFNLYEKRNMKVYKKGQMINVSGRNWWI